MLDQAVWRQNIAIEIRSLNRSSSTGRSATPQKRNDWTPTMELEMMQVSYFGAPLIPQSHNCYQKKFKVSTKKRLSDRILTQKKQHSAQPF